MVVEAKIGFLFITILGQSVQCCECCEQSVQLRCRPVQCCPGQHPAVASVALWGTVQRYPACSAGTRFADAGWMWGIVCARACHTGLNEVCLAV